MDEEDLKEIIEALRDSINDAGTDKVNFINWVDKIENYITNLEKENSKLKERKYYKFYKYENNSEGSDYCFCERPCDSNMSLHCFCENGEICGFMSETLVYRHPEIKEISMNEFMYNFVRPIIKENFAYKLRNK